MELLLGRVLRAEEAFARRYGAGVDLGRGGCDAAGVHLHGYLLGAEHELLVFRTFDQTEVGGREGPYRELVSYEFVDIAHSRERSLPPILSNSKRNAEVKLSLGAFRISSKVHQRISDTSGLQGSGTSDAIAA